MDSSTRGTRRRYEHWLERLRQVKPPGLWIVWEGGETEIKIRTGATRWQHATRTALVLAAQHNESHVEMRDEKGAVIEMLSMDIEGEDEVDTGEDAPEGADEETAIALSNSDARLLGMLISAQKMVLAEQRELLEPILSSFMQLAQAYAQYAAQVVELVKIAARVPVAEEDTEGNKLMREFMAAVTGNKVPETAPVKPVAPQTTPAPKTEGT